MAKSRATDSTPETDAAGPEKGPSVMNYFRQLFQENPRWLRERSNDKVIERWLQDHPDQAEMPKNVRNTLANVKSSMRKRGRKLKRAADGAAPPAVPAAPDGAGTRARGQDRGLEALELQIDECLTLARTLDRGGLEDVIRLLRRAGTRMSSPRPMPPITADLALQKLLSAATDVAEIRDGAGNLLGLFTPRAKAEALLYEKAKALFDPQEMERRLRTEPTGRPLADILKRLGATEPR